MILGFSVGDTKKFDGSGDVSSAPNASVIDLFCGAGGLSHGFHLEGFSVEAGIDVDESCRYAYEKNNGAHFLREDVSEMTAEFLSGLFKPGHNRVLVGCAPCQPFSTYNQKNEDPKWKLVDKFADLVLELQPEVVSMENVPQLLKFQGGKVFGDLVRRLRKDYWVEYKVVVAPDYGIPQRRSRLVMLASRLGPISLTQPTHDPSSYPTVAQAIGHLRPIAAGEVDRQDPLHRASKLSERNLARIKASRPGGSWRDWDDELVADCHRTESGKGYGSVYGRMVMNEPSPTITTQYYGFGNGRFGHPLQDRGLSLREGAILQSFPPDYQFCAPGEGVRFTTLGRMIGNAVPVLLGKAIARSIKEHLSIYDVEGSSSQQQ